MQSSMFQIPENRARGQDHGQDEGGMHLNRIESGHEHWHIAGCYCVNSSSALRCGSSARWTLSYLVSHQKFDLMQLF